MSVSRESLLKVLRDRVLARVQRGPLLDISIGKSARRFDLLDLGNDDPQRAYDGLNYVVSRSLGKITLPILEDEEAGNVEVNLEETAGKLTALDRITWEDVLTAATECLKGFQRVSLLRESAPLLAVPKKDDQIPANQLRIYSSAAVSIIDWIHQSVVADLAKLSQEAGESQLLDLFLGLRSGDREDGDLVGFDLAPSPCREAA